MQSACHQPRVMLWSVPRSCTTAVLRAVSNIEGGAFYHEPYSCALYFGPEKNRSFFPDQEPLPEDVQQPWPELAYASSINTFAWVKQTLESEHEESSLVFAKDFACSLEGRLERLPRGYQHTFLIRNPKKVIPSWRNMIQDLFRKSTRPMDEQSMEEWQDIDMGKHAGFKELVELYEYVKENLDPSPFVMDADDLIAQPEAVMSAYCKATGIPFSKKLIEWENDGLPMNSLITCRDQLRCFMGEHHLNAGNSRRFEKTDSLNGPSPSSPETNQKVLGLIERAMHFYDQLYQLRFVPEVITKT